MLPINAVVYSYANRGFSENFFFCLGGESVRKARGGAPGSGAPWHGDPNADEMLGSHPYYRQEPAHSPSPDEQKRVSLVRWEEYRRRDIEWFGSWGSHWGAHPFIETGHRVRIVRLPTSQVSEKRKLEHEAIYVGVDEQDVEFEIGSSIFGLRKLDAVVVPPSVPFRFRNIGTREVIFVELWPNP
jgi:mannose-6-phosphate isomerase-like protein (cupin superfamily)